MTFKTSFYGIPADVRANTVIPLLVGPPGANASVADGSITNVKLANVATATFKGRTTAGTGVPQDLTATQATALLNLADGSLKGLMSAADFTKLAGVASGATANTGTVTTVSVVTANGVSASVTNAGTTPAITITLGAITPTSIAASGQSLTGSQATPILDLATTWNTTGTPTALNVAVTDTASNALSMLFQIKRNGSDVIALRKDGYLRVDGTAASLQLGNSCLVGVNGTGIFNAQSNSGSYRLGASSDVILAWDAANTPAFRNGTNAQTIRLYRSFTDASNYSRLSLGFSATTAIIATEGLGTDSRGNLAFGSAALATSATVGYVMIPSCAGVPTGIPADIPTGQVALHYDSTNNRIYVYNGAWRMVAVI